MTPLVSLDDRDLALVALALESFADESRRALDGLDDTVLFRPVRAQLQQQIAQAEALLIRVREAIR